eukprot:gnl/Dysnectes_brevis/898_a995_4018.p1 GENE.gnl/Dysnectes_brevis/898_a995_4018~~gnl/Dysnectes_brevis/898_a995_4018.p1  ORF type:complete len:384 (+),score=28.20 gnl/Dysnectes_brevis/898_a995_4018:85-1236(+)
MADEHTELEQLQVYTKKELKQELKLNKTNGYKTTSSGKKAVLIARVLDGRHGRIAHRDGPDAPPWERSVHQPKPPNQKEKHKATRAIIESFNGLISGAGHDAVISRLWETRPDYMREMDKCHGPVAGWKLHSRRVKGLGSHQHLVIEFPDGHTERTGITKRSPAQLRKKMKRVVYQDIIQPFRNTMRGKNCQECHIRPGDEAWHATLDDDRCARKKIIESFLKKYTEAPPTGDWVKCPNHPFIVKWRAWYREQLGSSFHLEWLCSDCATEKRARNNQRVTRKRSHSEVDTSPDEGSASPLKRASPQLRTPSPGPDPVPVPGPVPVPEEPALDEEVLSVAHLQPVPTDNPNDVLFSTQASNPEETALDAVEPVVVETHTPDVDA